MVYYTARLIWFVICWLELAAFTVVIYLLAFLPRQWLNPFYYKAFRLWCRFFIRALGVDLRLHQKNTKLLPTQYIMIANHPSAFEDIGIPALFNVYCLAKIEVKDWWLVGRINSAAGTLFVKRESTESRHAAAHQIIEELKTGHNVALYPEGGCKGRRIFESFRYGAFSISLRTGIPIVPVFLHYEAQEDFEWAAPHTLIQKIWHFMTTKNNRANYYLYDAIDPAQFSTKEAYCAYVLNLYLQWQKRYLD